MQENPFDDFPFPDIDNINLDALLPHMCCACAGQPVVTIVAIQTERFSFCADCEHRSTFLLCGQQRNWPALDYQGRTGTYEIGSDVQEYVLTAAFGTNERVVELQDALDEWDRNQQKSA